MRYLLLCIIGLFLQQAKAQSPSELGWMPKIVLTYGLNDRWDIGAQVESRQNFFQRAAEESFQTDYEYVRTDMTAVLTYRLQPQAKISGAYMLRRADGESIHRSLQQVSITMKFPSWRLGHRFRTDQTFHY